MAGCSVGNKQQALGGQEDTAKVEPPEKTEGSTGGSSENNSGTDITGLFTIGFAQAGEESDWRTANTASMNDTFREANGYKLLIEDSGTSEKKQIEAVKGFVEQGVNGIVISLLGSYNGNSFVLASLGTEDNLSQSQEEYANEWIQVLEQAKKQGIPVILTGGTVQIEDEDLYTAWVGSDYLQEGYDAAAWLADYASEQEMSKLRVLMLEDDNGLEAEKQRFTGFREAIEFEKDIEWEIVSGKADHKDSKQEEDFQVLLCENDQTAIAAVDKLEKDNLLPEDAIVITFEGTKKAFEYMIEGKISAAVECTPLYGEPVREIFEWDTSKTELEKIWYVDEAVYSADEAEDLIDERKF